MNHKQRTKLAKKSLKGISIGDAFGESFFGERNKLFKELDSPGNTISVSIVKDSFEVLVFITK